MRREISEVLSSLRRVSAKIAAMRKAPLLIVCVCTAMVAGFALALRSGSMPLGVRGEWEWLRVPVSPAPVDVLLAGSCVAGYAVFVGVGMARLKSRATPGREALALSLLAAISVAVQAAAHSGAPAGYGLAKWVVALHQRGSSGYFSVAKDEVHDPWRFLEDYPEWIRRQDALHIGTHPPGLVVLEAALLRTMEGSPTLARFVLDHVPESVDQMFRVFAQDNPMTTADRATLALTGFLTLLACAATVVPLYLLARASLPAPSAWSAAVLWPLLPAAILFQPAADTAFPLFSASSLAFAAHAGGGVSGRNRPSFAFVAGILLGIGMQFTLAFLPVGMVVAVVLLGDRETPTRRRWFAILVTGLGFAALTLLVWAVTRANPFVIWWWNQTNHARFYAEFPRTYRAWVVANPVELFVAMGIPASVWACAGLGSPGHLPRVSVATAAVLVLLTLGGRNLSEVARLWLPFMPALLVAAGSSLGRSGAGPKTLAATVFLTGVLTLSLEAMIQVVYPI